jgi:hypothetical protein
MANIANSTGTANSMDILKWNKLKMGCSLVAK